MRLPAQVTLPSRALKEKVSSVSQGNFPEAGNLNSGNADMCSYVPGPSSSLTGDLFELSDR